MPEPNLTPNPQGNAAAQPIDNPTYKDLQQKKGIKSEEDLAKIYVDAEKELGRHQNVTSKVKKQLEGAGYTIDDEGNVKPLDQPPTYGAGQQPYQQPNAGNQPQETIYDPYTGQPITDPIALQLARMPVGHREAFVFNAMLEQREKQQTASYQAESEVLSKPEAKGFEDDVRKVMQQLPLVQRANKQSWEDALLRVKGMRYDQAIKNAGEQGVNQFINRASIQTPEGSSGGGQGAGLTQEQEEHYQWYVKNKPGLFKDRAHFAKRLSPNG